MASVREIIIIIENKSLEIGRSGYLRTSITLRRFDRYDGEGNWNPYFYILHTKSIYDWNDHEFTILDDTQANWEGKGTNLIKQALHDQEQANAIALGAYVQWQKKAEMIQDDKWLRWHQNGYWASIDEVKRYMEDHEIKVA